MSDPSLERIAAEIRPDEDGLDRAEPVFADQDSGCVSYGVVARGIGGSSNSRRARWGPLPCGTASGSTADEQRDRYENVDLLARAWLATLGDEQPSINPGA